MGKEGKEGGREGKKEKKERKSQTEKSVAVYFSEKEVGRLKDGFW